MLRTFRVLRVLKMLRYMKSAQRLSSKLARSLKLYLAVGLIMALLWLAFGILGLHAFGRLSPDSGFPDYSTLYSSLIAVSNILALENYEVDLFGLYRASSPASALFHVVIVLLGTYIVPALFLAVTLRTYAEDGLQEQKKTLGERLRGALARVSHFGKKVGEAVGGGLQRSFTTLGGGLQRSLSALQNSFTAGKRLAPPGDGSGNGATAAQRRDVGRQNVGSWLAAAPASLFGSFSTQHVSLSFTSRMFATPRSALGDDAAPAGDASRPVSRLGGEPPSGRSTSAPDEFRRSVSRFWRDASASPVPGFYATPALPAAAESAHDNGSLTADPMALLLAPRMPSISKPRLQRQALSGSVPAPPSVLQPAPANGSLAADSMALLLAPRMPSIVKPNLQRPSLPGNTLVLPQPPVGVRPAGQRPFGAQRWSRSLSELPPAGAAPQPDEKAADNAISEVGSDEAVETVAEPGPEAPPLAALLPEEPGWLAERWAALGRWPPVARAAVAGAAMQRWAATVVAAPAFDNLVFALVLANCVQMAFERPSLADDSREALVLHILDIAFLACFAVEAALKVGGLGLRGYFSKVRPPSAASVAPVSSCSSPSV